MGLRPGIPIIRTLKQKDCSELEVNLGYIIKSVPDTQQTTRPTKTNSVYTQLFTRVQRVKSLFLLVA